MSKDINLSNLNPVREIYNVIGSVCQDTELLKGHNIHLKETDFAQRIHRIIFSAISNIIYNTSGDRVKTVSGVDIDNYLSSYPKQYKVWNDEKGIEYVKHCIEKSNPQTFNQSYDRIKKMAILRKYLSEGFDISEIYDYKSEDFSEKEQMMKDLDKKSKEELFEYFTLKNLKIKDDFNIETGSVEYNAGEGVNDLLARLKKGEKDYGYPFENGYYNYLFRGMRKGKFLLRSANSGGGKTRNALADMCSVAINEIRKKNKEGQWEWVSNGESIPSLFISTELDMDELQTILLAYITDINERVILDGEFDEDMEKALIKAGDILESSPFKVVKIEDFSILDIEEIIERHVLDRNVQFVCFDYIQNVAKLSRTEKERFGESRREDQLYLEMSKALKSMAERYNIFIESGTQLNRNSKDVDKRDSDSLRGGSSTADKIDHGVQLYPVKDKDKQNIKHILEDKGFRHEPNYAHYIYKNRAGRQECIIWSNMDLGTMREEVCFVTDYDYNLIDNVVDLHFEFGEYSEKKEHIDIDKIEKSIEVVEDIDF